MSQSRPESIQSTQSNPLPITAILQDLALLRASGIELSPLLPHTLSNAKSGERGNAVHQEVLQKSKLFVGEMRKAIRINSSGDVDRIKERIDKLDGEVRTAGRNVERLQDELLEDQPESE